MNRKWQPPVEVQNSRLNRGEGWLPVGCHLHDEMGGNGSDSLTFRSDARTKHGRKFECDDEERKTWVPDFVFCL